MSKINHTNVMSHIMSNINRYCLYDCETCSFDGHPCDGCIIYDTKQALIAEQPRA